MFNTVLPGRITQEVLQALAAFHQALVHELAPRINQWLDIATGLPVFIAWQPCRLIPTDWPLATHLLTTLHNY